MGTDTIEDDPPTPLPEHSGAAREQERLDQQQSDEQSDDLEDADTEIDLRRSVVGEVGATPTPAVVIADVELQSVELSGDEAEQARKLAEQERRNSPLAQVGTDRVEMPEPINQECRMCGNKTTAPTRLRLSIPRSAGLRCDTCGNVFCREHAVRVSSLFESLVSGARFRCPLCDADK